MNLSTFHELLTPQGQECLAAAVELRQTEATFLKGHARLVKTWPGDLVKAALETAMLRAKAAAKFDRADVMYFTREALEQASPQRVAEHRAARYVGFSSIFDGCCGIGGDLMALAAVAPTLGVDLDDLRLAMAAENTRGLNAKVLKRDVVEQIPGNCDAAFLDPDRRSDGKRHIRLDDYSPRLSDVLAKPPAGFPLGVKVAPAVSWDDLDRYDCEVEFVSLDGELKEGCLWFGSLKRQRRSATVLPAGVTLAADVPLERDESVDPRGYLYDPDPSVTRAGLVTNLARDLGAQQIDPRIAFLTADAAVPTPFAKYYRILESLPFHAKRLKDLLRTLDIGHATIIKRGSAVDVNTLQKSLALRGTRGATVILTMVGDQPLAIVAEAQKNGA